MELMRSSAPPGDATATAAKWSLGVALAVLGLKVAAWQVTGSVALGSDAMESTVNVAAALAMGYALRVARRPADADHRGCALGRPPGIARGYKITRVAEGSGFGYGFLKFCTVHQCGTNGANDGVVG